MDSASPPVARSMTGKYEAALAPMMPSKEHDPRNAARNPPRGSRTSTVAIPPIEPRAVSGDGPPGLGLPRHRSRAPRAAGLACAVQILDTLVASQRPCFTAASPGSRRRSPDRGRRGCGYRGDHLLVARTRGGLAHRRLPERQLGAVSAENPPPRVECDIDAQAPIEAQHRDDHPVLEGAGEHAAPRVRDDPLGRDAGADLLSEDPGDPVLERLGPAAERRELHLIGAAPSHDLNVAEVAEACTTGPTPMPSAAVPTALLSGVDVLALDSVLPAPTRPSA